MDSTQTIVAVLAVISGTLMGGAFLKFFGNFVLSRRSYYKKLQQLGWDEDKNGRLRPKVTGASGTADAEATLESGLDNLEWYNFNIQHGTSLFDLEILLNLVWYLRFKSRLAKQRQIYTPDQIKIIQSLGNDSRSIDELRALLAQEFGKPTQS